MQTLERIEFMRSHGSSLDMNWGEDTGMWEVAWITSGKRYCGFSSDLGDALQAAHAFAYEALEKPPA